jgi:hypothetical protein
MICIDCGAICGPGRLVLFGRLYRKARSQYRPRQHGKKALIDLQGRRTNGTARGVA